MKNFKSLFVNFQQKARNKVKNIKNTGKNAAQKFKEDFEKAKLQPTSKRKSLFLGFITVISIYGVTLLVPVLPALAEDFKNNGAEPGNTPKTNPGAPAATPKGNPNQVCPATPAPVAMPSKQIVTALSGAAASICSLAVKSGAFTIGALCGLILVIGILKAQGK